MSRKRRKQRVALRKRDKDARLKVLKRGLAVVLTVGGLAAGLHWSVKWAGNFGERASASPFLCVRDVRVSGSSSIPSEELKAGLGFGVGDPLLAVRPKECEERLAKRFPQLLDVKLRRMVWGSVILKVHDRKAVALVKQDGGVRAVDANGVLYPPREGLEGLPELLPCAAEERLVALRFLEIVRERGLFQKEGLLKLGVEPPHDEVVFYLKDGTKISWGALEEKGFDEKYERLRWVMDRMQTEHEGMVYANLRYFDEGKIIVRPKSKKPSEVRSLKT